MQWQVLGAVGSAEFGSLAKTPNTRSWSWKDLEKNLPEGGDIMCEAWGQRERNWLRPGESGQRTRTDISPKKAQGWSPDTRKDAEHHSLSGECGSKPQ